MGYILWRTGCVHPFRISRILALTELYYMEMHGRMMTSLKYVKGPGVFYIEGLKEMLQNDPCFTINEDRHCIEYVCSEKPSIPEEYEMFFDRVIRETSELSDNELNKRVSSHKLYDRLFK